MPTEATIEQLKQAVSEGAVVLDVREPGLRQCLSPENAGSAEVDTAKLEKLFLSLA